jgi:Putative lumazine-binding
MNHHAQILAVADAYLDGVYTGNTEALAALFDSHAQVYGEIDGQPYHKPIAAYLDGVASRLSPQQLGEAYRMETLAIDLLGSIATLRLRSPMLGFNYHLYLTLRLHDDKWKIVNKTFTNLRIA